MTTAAMGIVNPLRADRTVRRPSYCSMICAFWQAVRIVDTCHVPARLADRPPEYDRSACIPSAAEYVNVVSVKTTGRYVFRGRAY